MKIKIMKHGKGGATVSIRAESEADKRALTDAVLSGRLTSAIEQLASTDSKVSPDSTKQAEEGNSEV